MVTVETIFLRGELLVLAAAVQRFHRLHRLVARSYIVCFTTATLQRCNAYPRLHTTLLRSTPRRTTQRRATCSFLDQRNNDVVLLLRSLLVLLLLRSFIH